MHGNSFFLASSFALSLGSEAQSPNNLYGKNNSYGTNCAEFDNVNVPIFSTVAQQSGKAPYFELIATHPSYIGTIKTFSNCPADFSGSDCQNSQPKATPTPFPGTGWSTLLDGSGNTTAYCKMLFDDHINRFDICRTPVTWWRNRDMTVSIGKTSETGNYIKLIKKISDANSWPEVMVLFEDGNLRFKPHPPKTNNLQDVCYGSSVIVGPAPEDATRPFIDISQVNIDPSNLCLDISYLNGGSANLCLLVDRTEARIIVNPNYGITTPIATFRSMWVADGNADVDRIKSGDVINQILSSWNKMEGSNFLFYRNTKSIHNPEAPDIAINLFATDPISCLFNWAEKSYPNLFTPPTVTQTDSNNIYRNYSDAYLSFSPKTNHVYYSSGSNAIQDVGDVSDFLTKSKCFVTTPELRECLFKWAETSFPNLLSPSGEITQFQPPYQYRYYQTTNSYVGISSEDNHVYYLPANTPLQNVQDVGGIYGWLIQASCQ